jgi:hypothetical protein
MFYNKTVTGLQHKRYLDMYYTQRIRNKLYVFMMNCPYNTIASIGDARETGRFFMLIDSIGAGQHAQARYYSVAEPPPTAGADA